MPAVTLTTADLEPFAQIDAVKAQAMIDDALAMAAVVAPCITDETFTYDAAAKAILRSAVLRWNDAGSGAVQSHTIDDYSQTLDNRAARRGLFWPSEITQLQGLCKESGTSQAYSIDLLGVSSIHGEMCALRFGANYCSCGADIAGFPIYETTT